MQGIGFLAAGFVILIIGLLVSAYFSMDMLWELRKGENRKKYFVRGFVSMFIFVFAYMAFMGTLIVPQIMNSLN